MRPMCSNKEKKKALEKLKEENYSEEEIRVKIDARNNEAPDVYDDVLRIPLIFMGPKIPKNKKVNNLVNNIDIFPTIAEIEKFDSIDSVDGKSLGGTFRGEKFEERPIYIESPPRRIKNDSHVTGIRTSEFKYFRDFDNPKLLVHLYDLKNNPDETKNVALDFPEVVKEMESKLNEILNQSINNQDQHKKSDEMIEVEKELKKLGYM